MDNSVEKSASHPDVRAGVSRSYEILDRCYRLSSDHINKTLYLGSRVGNIDITKTYVLPGKLVFRSNEGCFALIPGLHWGIVVRLLGIGNISSCEYFFHSGDAFLEIVKEGNGFAKREHLQKAVNVREYLFDCFDFYEITCAAGG